MNITSTIDDALLILERELVNSTITTVLTKVTITTTTSTFLRLVNSTRPFPFLRSPSSTTTKLSVLNKYFILNSPVNRIMRIVELFVLSFTLPLYAIVFILFIQLTVLRISKNTAISGGGSRIRSQRRRQRMHSLIWTSNYLLVDFLNLSYELIYIIIHITGDLSLTSFAGRFYCQFQVYVPLYLTVLMAYSLTTISIYRRRHFVSLNNQLSKSNKKSIMMISALWIMPIVTSIIPTFFLIHSNILKITQHETTNQCQISYTYGSNIEAIYICYRLGNIFLIPLSVSFACYLSIYIDLLRMQRRFSRAFKRHVRTRKNLITQILFLFLNFACFWLPAEIILLYAKNFHLKDALQVTKSLNILLDPLIITWFDTRFSSAARQLISRCPFNEFICFFNTDRQLNPSVPTETTIKTRPRQATTWNMADNDDITILESAANHSPQKQRRIRQQQVTNRPRISTQKKLKIAENHV